VREKIGPRRGGGDLLKVQGATSVAEYRYSGFKKGHRVSGFLAAELSSYAREGNW
jgi:hypothetical protein